MTARASQSKDRRRLVKTKTPGIYRRDDRDYVVIYRDASGRQRKRIARTLAEARTMRASLATDVHRGEYVEQSKVTFADYARDWIGNYNGRTSRGIRPGTLRDYRHALGVDKDGKPTGGGAVAHFGNMPLAQIRAQDVKQYAAEVAARGVARNTVRLAVAPVKCLLADAFEEGLIRSNPTAGLRLGKTVAKSPVKTMRGLTEEQVLAVLAEVPAEDRLFFELLAQTGMRPSEALALTKADIDFGRKRLSVTKRLYLGELDEPKSRNGVRQVPLSPGLARRLWTRLATADGDEVVFADASASRLYRVVRAAGERAGVEWPVGLYAFRHWSGDHVQARCAAGGDPQAARPPLVGLHRGHVSALGRRRSA